MKANEGIAKFIEGMRIERKSPATISTYLTHVRAFLAFRPQQPGGSKEERVAEFLSWLALNRSAETQRNALNALACFYRLLGHPLGELPRWVRPKEKKRAPNWLTVAEARAIIEKLPEPANEVASMLIGSGLRINECLRLRVKDIDLERRTVTIRGGKGDKDRVVMLAASMVAVLARRMDVSMSIWQEDRTAGRNGIFVPDGLERKFPNAGKEWPWFWLWPAPGESVDPATGIRRRHHRCAKGFSKALAVAVPRARVAKRVTAHAFRHGFATAYLMGGGTLPELQELMGHANIETTQIYLHCLPQLASRVCSPLDADGSGNITNFRKTA